MVRKLSNRSSLETANKSLEQILIGENAAEILGGLNQVERSLLEEMVKEIRATGSSNELENLWKYDYLKKPPTIGDFIEDPYWLGETLQPREDNPGLFPPWREILINDFDLDSRLHNIVITGSLGIGKTYVSVAMILYRLVLASLLRNPQNFVGLSKGSRIVYVIMSVTRAQVAETAFGDALNFMTNSPFFTEELHFQPGAKYSSQIIDLGLGIRLCGGSKSQHVIGRNTLGVLLDEGNWRIEANPDVKAYKLYDEIRTRIKNRFQKIPGFLPALSLIASSARDESSFTEKVMSDIKKINQEKLETIYSNSIYKIKSPTEWRRLGATADHIKKHALTLKERWFKVAYGILNVPPKILTGWYYENGTNHPSSTEFEQLPLGAKVELIPEDYLPDYKRNINSNLQSLSGISTGGSYRLLNSMADVEVCIENGINGGLLNPCPLPSIPISEEDDKEIWDYLDHKVFVQRDRGNFIPRRHPNSLRFAHMDLATRTMAGLSICHLVGYQSIPDLIQRGTGKVYSEARLIVELDFILTITSGKLKPISFEKIQKFFLWLRERCSFGFGLVTADTWQSIAQLQMLENRGFPTGSLSVDTSKSPYYALRSAIEEHRLLMYRQDWCVKELEELIDGPKKVDHPELSNNFGNFINLATGEGKGSKDTIDSVAGCVWNAITARDAGLAGIDSLPIHPNDGGGVVPDDGLFPVKVDIDIRRKSPQVYKA